MGDGSESNFMTRIDLQYASAAPDQNDRAEIGAFGASAIGVAAVAVGLAIHFRDGEYTPLAMLLVTLAIIAMGIAICLHVRVRNMNRWLESVLLAGILLQLIILFISWPGVDLPHRGKWPLLPFQAGVAIALLLIAISNAGVKVAKFWFPLLVLTQFLLGIWMVHSSPHPHIDVWVFQQEAAKELLHGHNPYAMTFPDIYHSTLPGYPQQVYGPGLVVNDRLQFGFPYPPVSLFLATIGYAIAHDHRYAQVLAIALSGALIGYSRPGLIAKLAAALLLFSPRVFFVLGRAWTEPFTIMLLAATVFLARRHSKLLPLALGLLIATKQYMILALPISFFLLRNEWRWRDWIDLLWKSIAIACIVTLPLALWDWHAFWKSTVTVQQLAPFRWDALSYLVWYGFRGHLVTEPFTAAFWSSLAALTALGLSLWRSPRSPAGFAASLAFISLAFFAFNKQAFCNYYFFVIGAICCAIGASVLDFPNSYGREPTQSAGV